MEAEDHKIEWLEFDLLLEHPRVLNKVFLRHGGTSKNEFSTLNASTTVGDHPDSVKANRELMKNLMQVDKILFANQVHKSDVLKVSSKDNNLPPADAIYTLDKNLGLAVTHADCQAAIVYEPNIGLIGVIHAGWKGLVDGIYEKALNTFVNEEGAKLEDMIVCISPSLGSDHAEFVHYKEEFPEKFWDFQVKDNYFDLKGIAKKQIMDLGVAEKNIEMSDTCTYCNSRDYYSHRRDKKCGRHATIVGLLP
jgi:YfiH family protein